VTRVENWGWKLLLLVYTIKFTFSHSFLGVHYVIAILAWSILNLTSGQGFYLLFEYLNTKGKLSDKTQKVLFVIGFAIAVASIIIDLIE